MSDESGPRFFPYVTSAVLVASLIEAERMATGGEISRAPRPSRPSPMTDDERGKRKSKLKRRAANKVARKQRRKT